jgi:hypothetical protein
VSRLVRLYPAAWRERYEAEFVAMLDERPPTALDRLDIIRGAIDARLHPQQTGVGSEHVSRPASLRLAGAVAASGGLCWTIASVGFYTAPYVSELGYKNTGSITLVAAIAAGLTGLAAVLLVRRMTHRPVAVRRSAAVILIGALGLALPWPMVLAGFFSVVIGTLVYGFIGASRLGATYLLVSLGALVALGFNTEDNRALLLIPLGAAWVLAGAVTIRNARSLSLRLTPERLPPP